MSLADFVTKDTDLEVRIRWIEEHDYDLYQYVKSVFNHKHYSRIILSIRPFQNQLNISFANLSHTHCMLLESKPLDRLSYRLEQGIIEALNDNKLTTAVANEG